MDQPTLPDMPDPTPATSDVWVTREGTNLYVRDAEGRFASPWTGLPMVPSPADIEFLTGYLRDRGYVVLTAEEALNRPARRTRTADKAGSVDGAKHVAPRAGTQKAALLAVFALRHRQGDTTGINAEQAADRAGLLQACYWKRVGELAADGYIALTGMHREGSSGVLRECYAITPAGLTLVDTLESR